jgi:hypothetical protein
MDWIDAAWLIGTCTFPSPSLLALCNLCTARSTFFGGPFLRGRLELVHATKHIEIPQPNRFLLSFLSGTIIIPSLDTVDT